MAECVCEYRREEKGAGSGKGGEKGGRNRCFHGLRGNGPWRLFRPFPDDVFGDNADDT